MSGNLSEDYKKRIKELEERAYMGDTLSKRILRFVTLYFRTSSLFLLMSCQFAVNNMDDNCKRVMAGYEDETLTSTLRRPAREPSWSGCYSRQG